MGGSERWRDRRFDQRACLGLRQDIRFLQNIDQWSAFGNRLAHHCADFVVTQSRHQGGRHRHRLHQVAFIRSPIGGYSGHAFVAEKADAIGQQLDRIKDPVGDDRLEVVDLQLPLRADRDTTLRLTHDAGECGQRPEAKS